LIYIIFMGTPSRRARTTAEVPRVRAKIFKNGRSQAVRLPKEFRMPGTEVLVHRVGEAVVLEPTRSQGGWPDGYWKELERLTRGLDEFPLPADPVPRPILES
jgi:antitoxin VapB